MIPYEEITKILPHRYPFLLLDRVLEVKPGKSCVALKNVSCNEPVFTGHFPGRPIFPGVMLLEAMAQVAGVLVGKSVKKNVNDFILLYVGVDKARFKRQIVPGDTLIMEAKLLTRKLDMWVFAVQSKVDDELACRAEIRLVTVPRR